MSQKSKTLYKKNSCRGKENHHTLHTRGRILDYCLTCRAYTDKTQNNICYCCRNVFPKTVNNNYRVKVLKAGVRQNIKAIKDWSILPTKDPFFVEIIYKGTAYEIEIKYLCLYVEQTDQPEKEKVKYIIDHLHTKGFCIFYKEFIPLDVMCRECQQMLVSDMDGKIFCKECNPQ